MLLTYDVIITRLIIPQAAAAAVLIEKILCETRDDAHTIKSIQSRGTSDRSVAVVD